VVEIVERAAPEPGPGEVLLEVAMCGLCGSDFAACCSDERGHARFSGPLRTPVVLGHETSGRVVRVGSGVSRVREGDLVAVESVLSCWTCDTCLSGRPAQCERAELLGLTRDGALADLVSVPERACFPLTALLDAGLPADEVAVTGALLEPLGVAYSALFLGGGAALPGDALVVYGVGALGALVGTLGRLAGCSPIVGVERNAARAARAVSHGFDDVLVLDLAELPAAEAARCIGSKLRRAAAEIQIEASGRPDLAAPIAQRLLAAGGRLTSLSRGHDAVSVDFGPWVSAAASLRGLRGRVDARAYRKLMELAINGRWRARDLVSRFVDLDEVPVLLGSGDDGSGGKIVCAVGMAPPAWPTAQLPEPAAEERVPSTVRLDV